MSWNLVYSMLLFLLAQSMAWFQFYGHLKIDFFKKNDWWIVWALAIPVSICFYYATKFGLKAFDGAAWPSRLLGFSMGILAFSGLAYHILEEAFTLKTIICLGLAFVIVSLQVFWK